MSYRIVAFLIALPSAALAAAAVAGRTADDRISFNRDIRPILAGSCFRCHGPDARARKADLRLDTPEGARRVLVAGHPEQSQVYRRVTEPDPTRRMPPPDSHLVLSKPHIDLIRRWIHQGAGYEKHWSFILPVRPAVPAIRNPQSSIRNPIDAFICARLAKEGLAQSPEAPREKLLRRVTMDLTGIPPTLPELDSFLGDKSASAYEKAVDRLLASPRFGERWAWEWLEAARYSDTNGYQEDRTRTMWPWRDWVIKALNADMPFDQFTVEQLAGDLLPNTSLSQKIATGFNRNHMLNGEGGRIPEESRAEYVVDRVDTTSTVWLGLTLGCARCHDHKYDPFTQREYYQLYAFFNNVPETGGVDRSHSANPVIALPSDGQKTQVAALEKTLAGLRTRLAEGEAKMREVQPQWEARAVEGDPKPPANIAGILQVEPGKRTESQRKELESYYFTRDSVHEDLKKQVVNAQNELNAVNAAIPLAMVMEERKEPRDTFVLIRGAYDKYGDKVARAVPAALHPLGVQTPPTRLDLARWLVDPRNPLTARVTVNRVWQQLFGTGLVKTSEDFGVQGSPPTHPDLLDWLAVEFTHGEMEYGSRGVMSPAGTPPLQNSSAPHPWSLKRLIKLIVMSAAYRQDSRVTPEKLEKDPENRLLSRGPRFRWPSFVLRDQALALSGLLVEKLGGPSVKPYQPDGVWEDFSYGKITYQQDHGDDLYRRSLYTFWRRSVAPPSMFDTAARRVCVVRTERTNTPLQALTMLNDVQFVEAARILAERVLKEASTPEQRIARAFRMATSRHPTPPEVQTLARGFRRDFERFRKDPGAAEKLLSVGEKLRNPAFDPVEVAAYAAVMNTILNLDETLSKE